MSTLMNARVVVGLEILGPALLCLVAATVPCSAQASASYKLTEVTLNAGGDPNQGSLLMSSHFHIRLDAIGDVLTAAGLASASFRVDAGPVSGYPPPGEVTGFRWIDGTTLGWNPEKSVGNYALYRGQIASFSGTFGACFANDLPGETTIDASSPAAGQGFYYLVTARNRLREEGTKGHSSDGTEESNTAPCP